MNKVRTRAPHGRRTGAGAGISIAGVRKRYGDEVSIGPVDLEIPAEGVTALIGPNGAGKSTLLTMIGRLLGMDEGSIRIAGLDVAATRSKDLATVVSILRQENHFVTRLTVRQLVGFGRFPHSRGRLTRADEDAVSRAIDFLGLGELEQRYLDELSGGQRQRAYVAMVLAQDTGTVLLDEPLNNLDMKHAVRMMRHLQRISDELGKSVVVVLHDINFAARYADRICAMKDGAVVAFGPVSEIMRGDVLTEVFETPVTVIEGPDGPLAVWH
ncbi:Iron(3+)-hydroxamate import ATP-binding protein FhuC [Microbacterium azadirachtae]|uniref:Iron(3+)-hydroxamate import ATP-binding protein FhuC n=1 Tax=Microbacterium azadirachtae TaxID=582680 RepID=A0A0F0KL16_9MICO|nr:ATP-binding cassette domain-containing protein [Microbacterium azadirachtae]KJL19956.1 Iron(3+)-hydroxamate import ATP-binding protein FhuC [Microbacterium azadirachtae]